MLEVDFFTPCRDQCKMFANSVQGGCILKSANHVASPSFFSLLYCMEVLHLPDSLDWGDEALYSLTRAGFGGHLPAQWLCMHQSCPLERTAKAEPQDELGAHRPAQELAALSTITH